MSETKTLYVVVCAAGPASDVGVLIDEAHERGWTVQLISTPAALAFIDTDALEKQTGRPVRSAHRAPGSPRSPKADAIIIAPATFNTINKLANGIADNYALDVTNEALGLEIPISILPFVNSAYANRTPLRSSIQALRQEGANVLLGLGILQPHEAGSGATVADGFPWHKAIAAIEPESSTQHDPQTQQKT